VSFFVELIDKYMDVAHVSKSAGFVSAMESVFFGRDGFFKPSPSLYLMPFFCGVNNDVGLYSMDPIRETLEKWIDFDILNNGDIRCSVGAVNVKTGNFTYFDTEKEAIKMHHIMASAALPPAFAPVEINGEYYWDGGLVSNTPLSEVLNNNLKQDAFVIQVDVWSARGDMPKNFADVSERMKDIQYSSKTRAITDLMSAQSKHKNKIREVLLKMPKKIQNEKWWGEEYESAKGVEAKVVHLIYKEKDHETHYKDYEFSSTSMMSHWLSGLNDLMGEVRNNFKTSVSFVM
jgi:NTE family protein